MYYLYIKYKCKMYIHNTPTPALPNTRNATRVIYRQNNLFPRQPPTRQSWSERFYPPKLGSLPLSFSQPLPLAFPLPSRLRSAFSPCSPSPSPGW